MSNEISVFKSEEFGKIRTKMINNVPYFNGNDAANALGYTNPRSAISNHCPHVELFYMGVVTGIKKDGTEAKQTVLANFIPESDMYRLISHSRLPNAQKFEKWIFEEVLPTIRKTGGYISGSENMSDAELMAKALMVAQKTLEERNKQIDVMKPKALFADAVSASDTSILIGELAKIIKQNGVAIGQNRFFEWLRQNGYLHKGGASKNMPTQKSMELGLFRVIERTINNADGTVRVIKTTKVTGKGQQYFVNKFLNERRE